MNCTKCKVIKKACEPCLSYLLGKVEEAKERKTEYVIIKWKEIDTLMELTKRWRDEEEVESERLLRLQ